jgi:hypothetical protein
MTKLFSPLLLFICLYSCGQNTSETSSHVTANKDSIAFQKKCVAFIKEVKSQEVSDTNFILADKPFSFENSDCLSYLLTDAGTYTKEELSIIKDKKFPSLVKWTKESFGSTKLVSSDTINAIFKDHSKWWTYFNKHIGRSFNTFSVPIFLRNDTYCLFYSDHHCGGLCGEGKLILYKKQNNKWTVLKSYCNWVS